MANKEKRLERLRGSPHGWAYDVLERQLEAYGFKHRGGSRHAYFVDPDDETNIVRIPRHKPVRAYVAEQVVSAIDRRVGR